MSAAAQVLLKAAGCFPDLPLPAGPALTSSCHQEGGREEEEDQDDSDEESEGGKGGVEVRGG